MGSPEVDDDGTDEGKIGALGLDAGAVAGDVGAARLDDGGVGANGDVGVVSVGASACALCVNMSAGSARLAAIHRAAVVDEAPAVEAAAVEAAAAVEEAGVVA